MLSDGRLRREEDSQEDVAIDFKASMGLGAGFSFFSAWNMLAALEKSKTPDVVRVLVVVNVARLFERCLANCGEPGGVRASPFDSA